MSEPNQMPLVSCSTARYDFYQTSEHLNLALYLKGYQAVASEVTIKFRSSSVRPTPQLLLHDRPLRLSVRWIDEN